VNTKIVVGVTTSRVSSAPDIKPIPNPIPKNMQIIRNIGKMDLSSVQRIFISSADNPFQSASVFLLICNDSSNYDQADNQEL
jgi:hypothetical protein